MLDWEQIKQDRDLINSIDWEITPREAFESYQLRSKDNWRARNLPEVVYFYLSTWKGEPKVLLVQRRYIESEELAQAPVPEDLVAACAARQDGEQLPRGQAPIDQAIKSWLQKELGL